MALEDMFGGPVLDPQASTEAAITAGTFMVTCTGEWAAAQSVHLEYRPAAADIWQPLDPALNFSCGTPRSKVFVTSAGELRAVSKGKPEADLPKPKPAGVTVKVLPASA